MAAIEDSQDQGPVSGVAARLRAGREAAGLSRTDIAGMTKIPERHLVAMEAGDFNAVGGRAYAIGFTRSYARAVGLDEAEITAEIRAELGPVGGEEDHRPTTRFEPGDPSRVPGRATAWIAALGAAAVIIAGFTLWRSYSAPPVALPPLALEEEPAPEATQPVQAAAPTPAAPQGPVVFTAMASSVWVKFYDAEGNQLMQKLMTKGETYTLPADAKGPQIWTGRPDALQITIGGKILPPLADSQMVIKDVPVSAAALLARNSAPGTSATGASPAASPEAARQGANRGATASGAAPLAALATQASTD